MLRCVHKLAVLACVAIAIVVQGCGGTTHLALNGPERAALEKASLEKKPVFVGFIETTAPDSKGAVDARAQRCNTSDKPKKHVDLLVVGYDDNGRISKPFAGDERLVRLRFEGPLQPNETIGATRWARVWHDADVSCVEIRRIDVTHTDGTSKRLGQSSTNEVLPANARKTGRRLICAG